MKTLFTGGVWMISTRTETGNPHLSAVPELMRELGTDEQGLSAAQASARLAEVGPNTIKAERARSRVQVIVAQFHSPLIGLLALAGGVALALGHQVDAAVIAIVVVLNALIGATQELRAARSLSALRRLTAVRARVVRQGAVHEIGADTLVPGDVLVLEAGDAVPADSRVIQSFSLQVAEAALTGESLPVDKVSEALSGETPLADRRNMLYAGTHVTAGRGRALVVATGVSTEIGQLAKLAQTVAAPPTPLERRVAELGRAAAMGAGGLFLLMLIIGWLRRIPFGELLMLSISQVVGMIPEGLPVAMTIALAVGVQRMAARRAIVRRLSAVETLGATTIICTDKTGTLTRNEMTVAAVGLPSGIRLAVSGSGYAPIGELAPLQQSQDESVAAELRALLEAGVLCNDAELRAPKVGEEQWVGLGDPTEIALLTLAIKGGINASATRSRLPRVSELPFDAARRTMLTTHRDQRDAFTIIKGAPEEVFDLCALVPDGSVRTEMERMVAEFAAGAMRVLAIARAEGAQEYASLRGRAQLLGVVGQIDPPREEVAAAVAACKRAGVRPIMVTGDHATTAAAIARQVGIADSASETIDGTQLDALDDAALAERVQHTAVFARVRPAQKLRIVSALQQGGAVVAMTGDGVNDAPALVRADVGVAMGSGTEVAKEASKVVIADDNFVTIVAAVEEGRVVYRNIQKVVLLLLSTSIAEVLVLLLALILGLPAPFVAVQILWNNLVTEGVITVNLIMESAEGDELRRPPVKPSDSLLSTLMWRRLVGMTIAIVAVTLGWFALRLGSGVPEVQARSEAFALLAICEWYNVLSCRSETRSGLDPRLFGNRWLVGGLLAGNALQALVILWPPLAQFFHVAPFPLVLVPVLGVIGSAVLWVEEVRKWSARRGARAAR